MHFSPKCSLTTDITMLHHYSSQYSLPPVIKLLHDSCHHNATCTYHHNVGWPRTSQCSLTPVIKMPHDPFHHNAPWPQKSQCSITIVINIFHNAFYQIAPWHCHHNAPSTSHHIANTFVIKMLHDICHHKDSWRLETQCSMSMLSEFSKNALITLLHALVFTKLHDECHQNTPWPSHHSAPCSCHYNAPLSLS